MRGKCVPCVGCDGGAHLKLADSSVDSCVKCSIELHSEGISGLGGV